MQFRRLTSLVSLSVLPWAACGLSSDLDDQSQAREFVAGDRESIKWAETLGLHYAYESHDALAGGLVDATSKRVIVDELGEAHVRLAQSIDGIPVFGGDAVVHLDADGALKSMTDRFARNVDVDLEPLYLEQEAVDIAAQAAGGRDKISAVQGVELKILPKDGTSHLAYQVSLEKFLPNVEPSMPVVFVDAHSGDVLWQYDNLQTQRNRNTYDARNRRTLPGTLVRTETQGPSSDAVLNLAHDNAGRTYDYYLSRHGRDSFNGAGATITSTVHYDRNYVNAFWNGSQMVYGDGNGVDSGPLVVLDVVGHELTHAVTETSSNLIYSNESGALNEAMSDIFGAAIEATRDGAVSANTWKIGEECWTPGTAGDALRYMNDPAAAGDYDYYPTRYTGTSDNGGVHWNSGIANLAFYLMVAGGSHPRGKTSTVVAALDSSNALNSLNMAAAIFYRANTVYLTAGSTFMDARGATVSAATDLYGATAASTVNAAWDAVGVPAPPTWLVLDTKGNLSGGKGSQLNYSYARPAGATQLRFALSGPNGDADLYVKFGSAPTTANYDCRSISATSNEACVISSAQQGTYYVLIYGYAAYSGLTFTTSYAQ